LRRFFPFPASNECLARSIEDHPGAEVFIVNGMSLPNLAKLAGFIRDPAAHIKEARILYRLMLAENHRLEMWLANSDAKEGPLTEQDISSPTPGRLMHYRYQWIKAIMMCLALILNNILQEFDLQDWALLADSMTMTEDLVSLVEANRSLRPLGMRYASTVLLSVRANSEDSSIHERVDAVMVEQYSSKALRGWIDSTRWLKGAIVESRLKVRNAQQLVAAMV
jgi:hypothetical protein